MSKIPNPEIQPFVDALAEILANDILNNPNLLRDNHDKHKQTVPPITEDSCKNSKKE